LEIPRGRLTIPAELKLEGVEEADPALVPVLVLDPEVLAFVVDRVVEVNWEPVVVDVEVPVPLEVEEPEAAVDEPLDDEEVTAPIAKSPEVA